MARDRLKYISSLLIFGMNGVLAHFIPLTSPQIIVTRCVLGGACLAAVFAAKRHKPDLKSMKSQWLPMLISGAAMGIGWVLLYETYDLAGVSYATLAYYCGPVIVMALSPLIFKERFTAPKLIGILAVMAGMLLVNFKGLSGGVNAGLITGLASAAFYALMIIVNKKIRGVPGLEVTATQLVVTFFIITPYVLLRGVGSVKLDGMAILCILLLGVVNTGLACYLYFSTIRALPAQTVAICSYIDPASALLFSALLLGERLTIVELLGAALILGGAAFGELGGRKRQKAGEGAA